ncbi:uncharacterized protein TRUGW13939_08033 [Talaromyces rugulosus]|uniref:Uncharacterized protein n=1 Tax=Talaromyces rugulosus TaxID=121627 RepID=A0A7H8R3U3_TALRU|nr:uncharacterized protein TRUGW13939_08033 [Talaromyces rugulosus]QKX60887.1 hypothetical protein TRUGW13939_08033 [Talaromyces rugulosus]
MVLFTGDLPSSDTDPDVGPVSASLQQPGFPIAIVGISCQFAGGVKNPEKLWELCAQKRSAWSKIPESRFNHDSFYDGDIGKLAMTSAKGGHFLEDDISLFDAGFFNFSTDVASSMDPQIRLQLESVFEATENAGIPLDRLAGSNTSVFSGCFLRDYNDSLMRDPEAFPMMLLTGNGAAMISNRISHFFDLRGPSMTIDTGCSSSLSSLHLGCQSLRSGDADISIVSTVNLFINPDSFVILSNNSMLSPDGKSYSFDSRANGYGRGEGIATLILKPLEHALRDGDNIRGIIRETAVNQNGKTPTLTSPSIEAQMNLIKGCYARAGLDPDKTPYVEAHMTGTPVGDPIEATAIGRVFGVGRPQESPLLVGSIKPNLGHMEASSGLAGVIKAVLALEKGLIPPNQNFETYNPAIDPKKWKFKVPTSLEPWPEGMPRRASVNNYGYGGTNGHAILEACTTDLSQRHQFNKKTTSNGVKYVLENGNGNGIEKPCPKVFLLTSKDAGVTQTMMANLAEYIDEKEQSNDKASAYLDSIAYTLGARRSLFGWRVAVSASTPSGLVRALKNPLTKPAFSREAPRLGFVFNGQGAQWFGMGRELFAYPVFRQAAEEADEIIRGFGAKWSLIEELMKDEASSRVHEAELSHVLCVALQLCLVKLLASWNIQPNAVVSHSSGEAAAAFAAGALTFSEALGIAYYRGVLAEKYSNTSVGQGSMLAVGLGEKEVAPYLESLSAGEAVVSCVNSPSNVTVSGDDAAIDEVEQHCTKAGVFARRLKVAAAYHSDHMLPMAEEYLQTLSSFLAPTKGQTSVMYGSPVTGSIVRNLSSLQASYWIRSLVHPVLFSPALQRVCSASSADGGIHTLIELGPHGALAGPIRQTLKVSGLKDGEISYVSCLTRGEDALCTAQNLVATLLSKGYPVDLNAVNFAGDVSGLRVLHDLPSYPWNHSTKYWAESRLNASHRHRKHAPRRLLGTLIPGVNPLAPSWRHFLRVSDMPWLRDHMVQSDIVFPGAGSISMAIEGLRQMTASSGESISGYKLRDIEFMNALVIPDTTEGIEVQLSFRQCNAIELDHQSWWEYHLYSISQNGDSWIHHSKGLISADLKPSTSQGWGDAIVRSLDKDHGVSSLTQGKSFDPESLFGRLRKSGIHHGPSFRNLVTIMADGNRADTTFQVQDPEASTPDAVSHIVHPTTLDSILQAAYCALKEDAYRNSMLLPRSISRLYVSSAISTYSKQQFVARSNIHHQDRRGFNSNVSVTSAEHTLHDPLAKVESLFCQSVERPSYDAEKELDEAKTCFKMIWHPDWTLMASSDIRKPLTFNPDPQMNAISMELNRATFYYIHDVLAKLTDSEIENLLPHYKTMLQWMVKIDNLVMSGELAQGSESWVAANEASKQILYDEVSQASVNGSLLCRIGHSLMDILLQRAAPLELMMEGKLLHQYYENGMRSYRSYPQVKQLVEHFVHKTPYGRILEIGGGTGGCTTTVLEALTSDSPDGPQFHFSHYDFTDVSSGFFEKASEKFAKWAGLMSFSKLDIEVDPVAQSFETGSYDLIIACQVLHATKSMQTTMTNVRKLLRPGGKLILVETTKDTIDVQLIFGTLPGWWAGTNDGRTSSPNLSVQSWSDFLTRTGFSGLDVEVGDCEDSEYSSISTMLTTAVGSPPRYPEEISIIWPVDSASTPGEHDWLANFRESLQKSTGIQTVVENLESFGPKGKFCISFLELFGPLLHRLDPQSFHHLRRIVSDVKGALWVSAGGIIDGKAPEYGMNQGFLRTLRMENRSKRLVSLDLEPESTVWSKENSEIIQKVIASSFDLNVDQDQIDCEFAVKSSCVHVARVYEDVEENKAISASIEALQQHEMAEFVGSAIPLKLEVGTVGLLDSLRFVGNEAMYEPLPDDYIEIEPKAFGVNFRDVLITLGRLEGSNFGFECSGVVTRVGKGISDSQFKLGDRVCAVMLGSYGTPVRLHQSWVGHIPDEASFEEAASMPLVFITVYQSLVFSARLEAGESVLIHAGSGGVGQAAIMLAKHLGAEIFVTVGTEAKRDFIMQTYGIAEGHIFSSRDTSFGAGIMAATNGKGVDVVLNSLAGNLLKESWNCIAVFGRFVEIGKRDIQQNKSLEMAPLERAASFVAIDLNQDILLRRHVISKAMSEVMSMWSKGQIKSPAPITQFAMSEMTDAFRLMQTGKHMGKVVCVPKAGDLVKVRVAQHVRFSPEASYLIVGGLGGIGRELARYMANRKCSNLIILSRSAADQPAASPLIRELKAAGCTATIQNCDVADEASLSSVLKACYEQGMPQVRGVVHGGMALHDTVFEAMAFEQWQSALRPKVDGTWNLHRSLPNLDFFIMLSSMCGVRGNVSQANYAASSTFQDAFARYRRSQGLAAVSIDLGPVEGIGFVAEHKGVDERLLKVGNAPIEAKLAMRVIESAMYSPRRPVGLSQVLTGISMKDYTNDENAAPAWKHDRRFWPLQRQSTQLLDNKRTADKTTTTASSIKDYFTNAESWDEVITGCIDALARKVTGMFALSAEEVDVTLPMATYGLDSLMAVEVRNWLSVAARAELSTFDIMQSSSLAALAKQVAQKSQYATESALAR